MKQEERELADLRQAVELRALREHDRDYQEWGVRGAWHGEGCTSEEAAAQPAGHTSVPLVG